MKLENSFQSDLIKELKRRFHGCIVMKNDSGYLQGIPDLTVLYGSRYALLECKKSAHESVQPNQQWYVDHANEMGGFARFIFPENKEAVLNDLEQSFKSGGKTLVPQPKQDELAELRRREARVGVHELGRRPARNRNSRARSK